MDYAGDGHPASEPQATADREQAEPLDVSSPTQGEYYFIYANGQLEVSPFSNHDELLKQIGLDPDHAGPMAVGYVSVNMGHALWEVQSNVSANALAKACKDYTKHIGWQWGGMADVSGEPIGQGSEFAPTKRSYYEIVDGKLRFSKRRSRLSFAEPIDVVGDRAYVASISPEDMPAFLQWSEDFGLTLVAGNDNALRTIEDLQQENLSDPNNHNDDDGQFFQDAPDYSRQPGGVFRCPDCQRLVGSWGEYLIHIRQHDSEPTQDGKFPEAPDLDKPLPENFTEQIQRVDPQ